MGHGFLAYLQQLLTKSSGNCLELLSPINHMQSRSGVWCAGLTVHIGPSYIIEFAALNVMYSSTLGAVQSALCGVPKILKTDVFHTVT